MATFSKDGATGFTLLSQRRKAILLAISSLMLAACTTMAPPQNPQGVHGMVAIKSVHNAKITMDRFEAGLKSAEANITARIDLAEGSQRVGQSLRPTEVLLWNTPRSQAAVLRCAQTVGIDLPQKAMTWQDDKGIVYLAWNDPVHLVTNRHETKGCEEHTTPMAKFIENIAKRATE